MVKKALLVLPFAILAGIAFGQVDVFNPATWFASQESVFAAAALLTPWITKIITALGKDWLGTDGKRTVWLSLGVAAVIAGIGGYLSLGYLADVSGFAGAVNAAVLTVIAFLASNGMAKNERQVATAAMARTIAATEVRTEIRESSHPLAVTEVTISEDKG